MQLSITRIRDLQAGSGNKVEGKAKLHDRRCMPFVHLLWQNGLFVKAYSFQIRITSRICRKIVFFLNNNH